MMEQNILITGAAGFIGNELALQALKAGMNVVGFDNVNPYYSVDLKRARLDRLAPFSNFTFVEADLADGDAVKDVFTTHGPFDVVIHLAAQAGVRYSLENPQAYCDSNITGFVNMLEGCRITPPDHFIYASSSSVYGGNARVPFEVAHAVDTPVSLYAATKRANELIAHSYSSLFDLPCTGLRFFTVYGPWGRPDMAYFKFVSAILEGRTIDIYNDGKMQRDFTYVGDIVEVLMRLMDKSPSPRSSEFDSSDAPYALYNIGNSSPIELMDFVEVIEKRLGRRADKQFLPMQLGDVERTYADSDPIAALTGFTPSTSLEVGVSEFVDWYMDFYGSADGNVLELNVTDLSTPQDQSLESARAA